MGCICCSPTTAEKNILRVVVYGLENSGKTSLIECLKSSEKLPHHRRSIATHGVIAVDIHLTYQQHIHCLVFDCGGCKHQRHIWPHLSNDPDVFMFVIDSFDLFCLNDAREALFDLLNDECLAEKPLLIVFTKCDQQKNIDIRHLEEKLNLLSIEDRSVHKVRFSSVTLDGFHSMLTWFSYFAHCKKQGKSMRTVVPSKYRLASALNLLSQSRSSSQVNAHRRHSSKTDQHYRKSARRKKKVSLSNEIVFK